jgi:hypothetical protein
MRHRQIRRIFAGFPGRELPMSLPTKKGSAADQGKSEFRVQSNEYLL